MPRKTKAKSEKAQSGTAIKTTVLKKSDRVDLQEVADFLVEEWGIKPPPSVSFGTLSWECEYLSVDKRGKLANLKDGPLHYYH